MDQPGGNSQAGSLATAGGGELGAAAAGRVDGAAVAFGVGDGPSGAGVRTGPA